MHDKQEEEEEEERKMNKIEILMFGSLEHDRARLVEMLD